MPRVVHFEINADDPERAIQFYTRVFGWKVQKWAGPVDYWLLMTGDEKEPGIDGSIARREDRSMATVNTVDVPSIDECLSKVKANGGTVVVPKMPIPGVGWLVYCKDTEGNTFGMMQADTNAG
jgi:predicted enzyme related to lactoylglutathione lyase